jgi:hypothetical protein
MVLIVRKIGLVIVTVILWSLLTSCGPASGFRLLKNDLTVRQFPGNSPQTQSMAAVTGTAVNEGEEAVTGCVITVDFYDEEKHKLGTATATKEALGPGEMWNFSVQITGPNAWKARSYNIVPSNR